MDNLLITEKRKKKKRKNRVLINLFFSVVFISLMYLSVVFLGSAPDTLSRQVITIPKGYSVQKSVSLLERQGVIRSAMLAKIIMRLEKKSIKSGSYLFEKPSSLRRVLSRISTAEYGDVYTKITIPEGSTNKQIYDIIRAKQLKNVNLDQLAMEMLGKEGFLFPDTYHFLPTADASTVVEKMSDTYKEKSKKAFKDKTIDKTENELVIMASLIAKEATNDPVQKQMISDILWKRIKKGQRLEVDAPFIYESGSGAKISELRKIPSAFNTYLRAGLTPAAIGNPDYDSLYAAAHPKANPYYFYLHAKDGNIYYGKNYDQHLKNIKMYLR